MSTLRGSGNVFVRLQQRFETGFEAFRERYHRLLERCLHHQRAFLIIFFAACLGSLAVIVPWLGQDFFPSRRRRKFQASYAWANRDAH